MIMVKSIVYPQHWRQVCFFGRSDCKYLWLTVSELSIQYHNVLFSVINKIVMEKLGYKKLCVRCAPNIYLICKSRNASLHPNVFCNIQKWSGWSVSPSSLEMKPEFPTHICKQPMQWRYPLHSKKGILLLNFMECGLTINAAWHIL